nr:NAD-dependent epimerase/dehydratase family protein [Lebetimonas sp. JH292]
MIKLNGFLKNEKPEYVFLAAAKFDLEKSGKPMREFLYSDDMADACVFLMENVDFKDIVDGYISNSYIGENKQITPIHI